METWGLNLPGSYVPTGLMNLSPNAPETRLLVCRRVGRQLQSWRRCAGVPGLGPSLCGPTARGSASCRRPAQQTCVHQRNKPYVSCFGFPFLHSVPHWYGYQQIGLPGDSACVHGRQRSRRAFTDVTNFLSRFSGFRVATMFLSIAGSLCVSCLCRS